jgi:hypothetical protein
MSTDDDDFKLDEIRVPHPSQTSATQTALSLLQRNLTLELPAEVRHISASACAPTQTQPQ